MKELIEVYKEVLNKIKVSDIKLVGVPTNIDIVYYTLNDFVKHRENPKKKVGTVNELLIAGNLYKKGYNAVVQNDNNKDYDILIDKDRKHNIIECKLDNEVHRYDNFFFEYWNYTYNRPTGINNSNLDTLYTHTYYNNKERKYYFLAGKRKLFIEAIQMIRIKEPKYIRQYEHTYYTYKGIIGDAAYIVKKDTFLKYFKGYNLPLKPLYRWK